MTAFGPYKNTETVDFKELNDNNLFVISGNTGAGKTTIFDGICFALYGSASGTDREDHKMLRSDFAEDDTHTSIELEFELRGRMYRILRQLGHVKQGNKSKTGEKYEFYEKIGEQEVPCVDRQIVSEIDKKVESIIGLTQDQFKQIVMLPQGEFRKLLTSQTENKEAILRRLFKTESYKEMNEILRNKKQMIEKEFDQSEQSKDQLIQQIRASLPNREDSLLFQVLGEDHYNANQVVTGLEQEAVFYQQKIEADQDEYDQAYKSHERKQEEFSSAKVLNERFQELDQKENQRKELQDRIPEFRTKEKQFEDAERASNLEVYEKQVIEWTKDEQIKSKALTNSEFEKIQADQQLEKTENVYRKEESRKAEREEIGRKIDRLKEYLPTVKDITTRERQLQELAVKGNQAKEKLKLVKESLHKEQEKAEKVDLKIKQMDKDVSQLPEKHQQLTEMREKAKVLKDFLHLKQTQTQLTKDLEFKKTAYEKSREQYQTTEELWMNNQASLIATHLHDGKACPVCGSLEHPNKATQHNNSVTKDELEQLKKELDEKADIYRNAAAKQEANLSQLKEKTEELSNFSISATDAVEVNNKLVEEGTRLNKEVKELQEMREVLVREKESYETIKNELKKLDKQKEEFDTNYQELRSTYQTSKAVYDERLRNIPEEYRTLSKLEEEIQKNEQQKYKLDQAWEQAQKQLDQAKLEQTKATSNHSHAVKQLEETNEKLKLARNQFKEKIEEAEFESENAYQEAKIAEAECNKLKDSIQKFNEKRSLVEQQVEDLRKSLHGKSRVNVLAIEEEVKKLKETYEIALNKLNLSKEYLKECTELKQKILDVEEQLRIFEKKLTTITDLYNVTRGQNEQKISFERYLQIEYLEQIIEAANERLKRLSNGQYYLIRSDRQESHGRQSGLALDVYDAYTGQTRDVKTLSGGEKFNASLCLALGMSDVIQSFQGNISINTMFIDEGFGSLDEESLNKSIDTLVDLQQSGRMIGVISHVQELKTMFPATLQVSKTKEGHSQTKFVVK